MSPEPPGSPAPSPGPWLAVRAGTRLSLTSAAGLGRRLDDPDVPKPVDLSLGVHRGDFVQKGLALRKVISGTGDEGLAATKQDPEGP